MKLSLLLDWRLHVLVAVASLISEAIGIIKIPLGPGSLLLLPLFYAFIIGLLVNPHLFSATSRVVPVKLSEAAAPIILLSIMPFIARFGSTIGPAIEQIPDEAFPDRQREMTGFQPLVGIQRLAETIVECRTLAAVIQQHLPHRRRHHALPRTLQQRRAQRLLDQGKLTTDRRRRNVQPRRRLTHRARLDRYLEVH